MDIELMRVYFPEGTNGELYYQGELICYTIELPWKNNARERSCIPEGKYSLARSYSSRFGWHLLVEDVPGRTGILLHAANTALTELRGCIAPVTILTAHGCGTGSKAALRKLINVAVKAFGKEHVYLTIKKK